MIEGTVHRPRYKVAALFAHAAGVTGILANLFLLILYIQLWLRVGSPENASLLGPVGELAGPTNDLLGSLAAAFMIPVALFVAARLPRRPATRLTQAAGLIAMVSLAVGGPLLVLGVLAFEVATVTAVASYVVLCLWLFLANRWLRQAEALRSRVTRFGQFVGAGYPVGFLIVGLGLLLPWMSWPQQVVFGAGLLVGLPAYLGIPVWFLLLGGALGRS